MGDPNNSNFLLIFFVTLILLFVGSFGSAYAGWGYLGYGGKHVKPSWFYDNKTKVYQGRSIKEGSVGSTGHRGGGVRGGK